MNLWKNFEAIPSGTPEELPRICQMKCEGISGTKEFLEELRRNSRKNSEANTKEFQEKLIRKILGGTPEVFPKNFKIILVELRRYSKELLIPGIAAKEIPEEI